jgi:hypothetical protein
MKIFENCILQILRLELKGVCGMLCESCNVQTAAQRLRVLKKYIQYLVPRKFFPVHYFMLLLYHIC